MPVPVSRSMLQILSKCKSGRETLHIPYINNSVMNLAAFKLSESSVLQTKLIKIPLEETLC